LRNIEGREAEKERAKLLERKRKRMATNGERVTNRASRKWKID
jgi:hypothetical protein